MKKNYFKIISLFIFAAVLHTNNLFAQCAPATASSSLDINNVNAGLLNGGDGWWDLSNAKYEVPKGSGKHSLFAGGLWIGGVDSVGNIKLAAQTYRQTGNDFWPGPIVPPTGMSQTTVCSQYNQMWKINKQEVIDFLSGSPATTAMTTYPGTFDGQLFAPYFDANNDNLYNALQGDYPLFDLSGQYTNGWNNYLHGDQSVWWVFNDTGNVHTESGGAPLGIEMREEAYSYSMPGTAIDNTTFYQYTLINKSNATIDSMYFGQWVDPDLGNYLDDYVGCDVNRNMGYCYNGDPDDDGPAGYGLNPPAIGVRLLQGPLAPPNDGKDNNHDGVIDEPDEQILMSKFLYYNNLATMYGNPSGYNHYYNYLKGVWGNGQVMTFGQNGFNPLNPPCDFMFCGSTDPNFSGQNWTENFIGNAPSDRRFLMSCGPFTMAPGQIQNITIAVVWAQDSSNSGGIGPSVGALQVAADSVQSFFALRSGITFVQEHEPTISASLYPNPFSSSATLSIKNPLNEKLNLKIYDARGLLVKSYNNITDKFIISGNQLSSGLYFYKVESEKQNFVSGKFVIE